MAGSGRQSADALLIAALASGATVRDAAIRAGVGERTAFRRMDDPEFRQRLAEAQSEVIAQTVRQLSGAGSEAAEALRKLLNAESENVRLGAARATIELGFKLRESVELERRIQGLEGALAATDVPQRTHTGWKSP